MAIGDYAFLFQKLFLLEDMLLKILSSKILLESSFSQKFYLF